MDLINRYAHEVGQYLPHRLRADVEAELRSLLTDSVEEKARQAGIPADDALAATVLREFGAPKDAAARYSPEPQYLIGPRLYPTYLMAVKVMLAVLAAIVLALVVAGRFRQSGGPTQPAPFVRATGRFLWGALENLGIMTLVFALVERSMRRSEANGKAWDPSSLPQVDDPDRISYFGRIFALYLIAMLVLAFNVFPDWVALYVFHGGEGTPLSVAHAGLQPLPAAAQRLVAPRLRPQPGDPARGPLDASLPDGPTSASRSAWAVILLLIVTGPPVFRYDAIIKIVLQWFLVFSAIRACVQLYRLLARRPAEPWARR